MLLCSLTNFRERSYSTGYLILHERITVRQTAPKNGLQISDCQDLCTFWTPPAILNEWGNAVKIQCSVLAPTPPVFIWKLTLTTVLAAQSEADPAGHQIKTKGQNLASAMFLWVWFWFFFVGFLLVCLGFVAFFFNGCYIGNSSAS